jgi:hypothetical protein
VRLAIVTFALMALGSAVARADEDTVVSPFVSKPTALYFVSGPRTPVGFFGFEAEQNLTSFWTVAVGGGFDAGPQVAAMTRLLLGGATSKLALGVGVSHGKFTWVHDEGDEIAAQKSGTISWANFEIGGAHRWRNGFSLKYFVGYTRAVAGELVCEGYSAPNCLASYQNDGYSGLYTGAAVGGAF